jgi:hypothetical protein
MEFKIEKDLLTLLPDHIDNLWSGVSEELFSHFKCSYVVFEKVHPMLSFPKVFHVEGKNDFIFRIVHGRAPE